MSESLSLSRKSMAAIAAIGTAAFIGYKVEQSVTAAINEHHYNSQAAAQSHAGNVLAQENRLTAASQRYEQSATDYATAANRSSTVSNDLGEIAIIFALTGLGLGAREVINDRRSEPVPA